MYKNNRVCDYKLCTGCEACKNICPKQCIMMIEDTLGNIKAAINLNSCISCGLCKKICPVNKPVEFNKVIVCFAAVRKNRNELKRCASGGIATLLMEQCFLNGFKVFGSRFDEKMQPRVMELLRREDIEHFKGSLYVQSFVGNAFSMIKNYLNSNESVLFVGTPCQVAGLRSFLQKKYTRLVCCDLFCHGVSPYSYLEQELKYLNKGKITNITFRGYHAKEDHWLTLWDGTDKVFKQAGIVNYYLKAFYDCVTLRDNCYMCRYATDVRIGDISLGDFLGLKQAAGDKFVTNCVTAVLINTPNGEALFNEIKKSVDYIERPCEEVVAGGPSLQHPSKRPKTRDRFEKYYSDLGYSKSVRKALFNRMIIANINRYLLFIARRLKRLKIRILTLKGKDK